MSLTPESAQPIGGRDVPPAQPAPPPPPDLASRPSRRRLWRFLFAIFSFEVGLFLTVFPWLDSWTFNHVPSYIAGLQDLWDDPYFKGAVTGLGLVNLFIAFRELAVLIRRKR